MGSLKIKAVVGIAMVIYILIMALFFSFIYASPGGKSEAIEPVMVTRAEAMKFKDFDFNRLILLVKDMHSYLNGDVCGPTYGFRYNNNWVDSESYQDTYRILNREFDPLIQEFYRLNSNLEVMRKFFEQLELGLSRAISTEYRDRVLAHRIFHDLDYHIIGDLRYGAELFDGKDFFRVTGLQRGAVLDTINAIRRELRE